MIASKSPKAAAKTAKATVTRVIKGDQEGIRSLFADVAERAAKARLNPILFFAEDFRGPRIIPLQVVKELRLSNPKLEIYCITNIQKENLPQVKEIIALGLKVRHIAANRSRFVVTNDDYIVTTKSLESGVPEEIVWSNSPEIVSQMLTVFRMFWDSAIPAEARLEEIEQGIELGETRIIKDLDEVAKLSANLVDECREEILVILSSDKLTQRNSSLYQKMVRAARSRNLKVRILVPSSLAWEETNKEEGEVQQQGSMSVLDGLQWRRTEPISVGFSIYDRKRMLVTQENEMKRAVFSNIYSMNSAQIHGIVSIFDALWRDSELKEAEKAAKGKLIASLEREAKLRRQAELLQDILTHDIRNYNQVIKLSSELLREELSGNPEYHPIMDTMLDAVNGSTELLARGRQLGKVLVEANPLLFPVSLIDALESSISLVGATFKGRKNIHDKLRIVGVPNQKSKSELQVFADDLLQEIFINVFTNSAKYTEGGEVEILTEVFVEPEEADEEGNRSVRVVKPQKLAGESGFLKISISDEGRGISDSEKPNVFSRYLKSARGSGLGMSIVHALVVERYKGKIRILNRVPGDYTKGTRIEISLPRAKG